MVSGELRYIHCLLLNNILSIIIIIIIIYIPILHTPKNVFAYPNG
jgi:hypothetical protein